jgi:hypothetical protein
MNPPQNYWRGVVSRSHIQVGIKNGVIQLNHAKKAPLQRFGRGDGIIDYSPRTDYPDGDPWHCFTAIGKIRTGKIYQVEMTSDFKPYRLDIRYLISQEIPIKPLIDQLSFIKNKIRWGATFRLGFLKLPLSDFLIIAEAMGVKWRDNF